MKIVNKTKFIRTSAVLGLILGMVIIFSTKTYSKGEIEYKTEYICKGETLWNIAKEQSANNKYFENEDIRNIIYELQNINDLQNSNLYEGMKIKIPIYK